MTAIALVPDALRPSWMRAAWEGEHGARGIHAVLDDPSSTLELHADGIAGMARVEGSIVVPDTVVTGRIHRSVSLHRDGRLALSHNLLSLPAHAQGTGYARALNDHAFARYAEAGVESVRTHASLGVGGYAWARQGFELNVSDALTGAAADRERGMQLTRLVERALHDGRLPRELHDSIADRLVRPNGGLPEDALVSIGDLAAIPDVGPAVLLKSDWYGTRPVASTQPWWQGGADQAATGAANLAPAEPAAARAARSQVLDATLPDAFRRSSRPVFESALRAPGTTVGESAGGGASTAKVVVRDEDVVPETTTHLVDLGGGRQVRFVVSAGPDDAARGAQFASGVNLAPLQPALDDAWRSLGVRTLARPGAADRSL